MGLYGIAREGIWIDHNGVRGPILIESEGYPLGFPRSDFSKLDVLHDGGSYMVCYLEGSDKFLASLYSAEPDLTSPDLSGLLDKVISYSGESEKKKKICVDLSQLLGTVIDIRQKLTDSDVNLVNSRCFNHKFTVYRPSKQEIAERGLLP